MVLILLNMIMMMIRHDEQSVTVTVTLHILFYINLPGILIYKVEP